MLAHLTIGTSTDRIDLLNDKGFYCQNWRVGGYEPDGIWQESQLADFRQLAAYRDVTVIERFELVLKAASQDLAARMVQDMRAMLRLCLDYWTTTWQTSVVYLEARASCETNMRYAVVYEARLVGESNPFGQPFLQHGGSAVMDELGLLVERGPWLDSAPGSDGTCIEISSQGADQSMFVLDFDATDDDVNCGSDASIDDLPSGGNFTAEAWVMADGWGEGTIGHIFNKNHWRLYIYGHVDFGIVAWADHATTDAVLSTGTDDFAPDSQWHHIAAVWTLATKSWDIAVDGVWVTTPGVYDQAGVGAYTSDAADDLIIGNDQAGAHTWDGKIGLSRISSSAIYKPGLNFTPPDRCDCPAVLGSTEGLWCLTEGSGATAYDETANSNDGTITGATWLASGCTKEYMEETCDAKSVFVANKHNTAQITNINYWDHSAGAWSANLIGAATPFAFMPPTPMQQDDFVVFGINTGVAGANPDTGPFCSLVFDIGTAIGIGTGLTITWRYHAAGDGADPTAWTALTVQDNTNQSGLGTGDAFDTTGICSVHWEQNQTTAWTIVDPDHTGAAALGVTGYFICAHVSAVVGGNPTPPTQDNRDIYTVTWPYIEFTADKVSGDMPALLRLSYDNRAAYDAAGTTTDLWCQRMIAGLRSYDRGPDFTAYINISDEQNGPGITVTAAGGTSTFQDWVPAATARALQYAPVGVDAWTYRAYIRVTSDWYGRFHAFVRGKQHAGVVGCVNVRLSYSPMESGYLGARTTTSRQFLNTNGDQLLDFGEIVIGPATSVYPLQVAHTYLQIEANCTDGGGATAYFYELILMPIDEWAIDAEDTSKKSSSRGYTNDFWARLSVDGIRNQRSLLSFLVGGTSGQITKYWRPITNGIPILQTGKKQRLWFMGTLNYPYNDADNVLSAPEICSTIQVWKQQRYTTLRGDR